MSVFVDTGVWFAHHDRDATRHVMAVRALERVLSGRYGQPYVSDYVYDEAVTLTRGRTGSFEAAKRIGDRIRGVGEYSPVAEMRFVSGETFAAAVEEFERYHDHPISFTDAATIALVKEHDVDYVLSFDTDFDGIVERLDPENV